MERYAQILERLMKIAAKDVTLRAVIAIGSGVRSDVPADEYSDLDLIIAADSPKKWLYGDLPHQLGEVRISFVEPTLGGGMERRMLYEGSLDVDLIVFTPEQLLQAVRDGTAACVMNRGYTVLHDTMDVSLLIVQHVQPGTAFTPMEEDEFVNMVNDFFFHAVWAEKKLRRGEWWTAKMCIDAYLKRLLLRVLELAHCKETDVWHDGRFLDRWAGKAAADALKTCFAHYEPQDMADALRSTCGLFGRMARQAAQAHGYAYPVSVEEYAASFLSAMQQRLDYSPGDGV